MHPSALAYLLRSRLSLPTLEQVSGSADGLHVSFGAGQSLDFLDLMPYQIGDDVSAIDWKTTARLGEPVIKRFERHSIATMALVVDTGNSMAALAPPWSDYDVYTGRSTTTKEAIAAEVVEVFAHLALLRGDKVGMVAGHRDQIITHLPRHGKDHIRRMVSDVRRFMDPTAPPSDLPAVLYRTRVTLQQPTVVLVITDNSMPSRETLTELRRLRRTHWVGVITVPDVNAAATATATEAPARVVDVDSGLTPVGFFPADQQLIDQYNQALATRHWSMMDAYDSAKVTLISLTTRAQLPSALIHAFGRYRSGRRS